MSNYWRGFKTAWEAGWQDVETARLHRARSRVLLIRARQDSMPNQDRLEDL